MKTYEVWTRDSNPKIGQSCAHTLEADYFTFSNGVYFFMSDKASGGIVLHAIVTAPGMLVNQIKE